MDEMDFIPPRAKHVVEFGCGEGNNGVAFKRIQPVCHYFGIDTDLEKLKIANHALDGAAQEFSVNIKLEHYGLENLDCILYHSSYLQGEQLMQSLQLHMDCLAEDGQMLFFLDNAGSFSNIMQLIKGEKPFVETNWTLHRLMQGLQEIGLGIDQIFTQCSTEEKLPTDEKEVLDKIKWYQQQQKVPEGGLDAIQYVIRAVRKPVQKQIVLMTMPSEPVCGNIRIKIPNRFFQTIPGVTTLETSLDDLDQEENKAVLRQSPIVLLGRILFLGMESGKNTLDYLAQGNRLVLHEFDDCPAYWESFMQRDYLEFRCCHAVQTSTKALGEYFKQYNPHVLVFPNELTYLPEERRWNSMMEDVTIFFGALNRRDDWQEIMPVLNEMIARYGKRLHFKVAADGPFFDALHTEQKEYVGEAYNQGGFAPYELYMEAMHTSDIALLPLRDNLFNRMKSDLKFIEAAGNGAVVLASPTVYQDSIRDGRTGFLYHDPREFREWLTVLIENPMLRCDTAQLAYRYVKENRLLAQHYEERVSAYQELKAHLPALERERRLRLARMRR